jgi:hypothetical protein
MEVDRFIYYFCAYPIDPSDHRCDLTFKFFTSLDQFGNSLDAHLAFGHLSSLQSLQGVRCTKNGAPGQQPAIPEVWEYLENEE